MKKTTGHYRSMTGKNIPCVLLEKINASTVRLQVHLEGAATYGAYTHGQIFDAEAHKFTVEPKQRAPRMPKSLNTLIAMRGDD